MTLTQISLIVLLILLIGLGINWIKVRGHNEYKFTPWQDHSMRLGQDYFRVRHILRLGELYNHLDLWNYFNPFSGDESETMYRIRKIIETYKEIN